MLVCTIAFSNIQRNYSLPAYVLGIIIDEGNLQKLEKIRTKESFRPSELEMTDPFDLGDLEREINLYAPLIHRQKMLEFPSKESKREDLKPDEIISAFNLISNRLIYSDILVQSVNIREIRLHEMYLGRTYSDAGKLTNFFNENKIKTVIEKKPNYSPDMELTRLMVWYEYIAKRRQNIKFVKQHLEKHPREELNQILHIQWPYVRLEMYSNFPIGNPHAIIRNGHNITNNSIEIGKNVSLFVLAKSCIGQFNSDHSPYFCLKSKNLKYGDLLPLDGNEIHCSKCRSASDRLKFGRKGIKKIASMEDEDPLENYSDAPFFVYVTRFHNRLKVGRTRLSRGISRLLEQGCSTALVMFPILSFDQADKIEKEIEDHLSNNMMSLKEFDVDKVGQRAFLDDKLMMIKDWNDGTRLQDESLYKRVIEIIRNNEFLDAVLQITDNRLIDCTSNWKLDDSVDLNTIQKSSQYWTTVEGKIKGIVGSLLFVDDKLIDMEKLQGCLFRGSGFK